MFGASDSGTNSSTSSSSRTTLSIASNTAVLGEESSRADVDWNDSPAAVESNDSPGAASKGLFFSFFFSLPSNCGEIFMNEGLPPWRDFVKASSASVVKGVIPSSHCDALALNEDW